VLAGRARTSFSEKALANLLQQTPETQTAVLFFYKSTGRITRKMGAGDYIGGHETLPLA
jgi:hypothetical protein